MQRRRQRRRLYREAFAVDHIQLPLKLNLIKRSDPPQEPSCLRAAAQEDVAAVIDEGSGLGVSKRGNTAAEALTGFEQCDGDALVREFAGAGDARYPATYDRNSGRYDLPPDSLDRTSARAAIATFRRLDTDMDSWNTS